MDAPAITAALQVGRACTEKRGWLAAYAGFEVVETREKIERRDEGVFMAGEKVNRWRGR